MERGQAGPAQTAPRAPVPTQAASTVSVTVVSEPPTRQRRQRAPGAEGRPQPPVLCCRHLPVPDHLVQQLHRLACHLLWLQLRVGSGGGAQGPRISLRPPASSLAFHHLARVGWTCLPSGLVATPPSAHVPAGHLCSGRQLCRASCTTCESGSWALGGDSDRGLSA